MIAGKRLLSIQYLIRILEDQILFPQPTAFVWLSIVATPVLCILLFLSTLSVQKYRKVFIYSVVK